MNRGSFFKSLLTLIAAPKLLSEIDFTKAVTGESAGVALSSGSNMALISQLQLITPHYYKQYIEKYGSEDFAWFLDTYSKAEYSPDKFWSSGKLKTEQL